jgi:hypothetical protein
VNTPADHRESIGGLTVAHEIGSANSPVASDEPFRVQPSAVRPTVPVSCRCPQFLLSLVSCLIG